tara:strand:+ start:4172 stop:4501 length:330 start_codon:yes stop_codon:yes gene_type:complete
MTRPRRLAANAKDEFPESKEEWLRRADEERKVNMAEHEVRRGIKTMNLVQTALAGVVCEYVTPDHQPGEQFPGRQPPTTQLSLFESGFKRQFQWDEVAGGWVSHSGQMC